VNIRYQVINFMVAGTDTTSGALSFALYYLARNPDAMARARSEVDELWADGTPDYEQVIKLRYLRRVVEEGMRLWPPVPGYWREAREDTMLAGRYPMKAGEAVFVLLPALHRHPVWGNDPGRFDPDRFLPARVKSRPAHVYKPFGTGERACLGRQFALHEAALVLGTLVRRYDLAVVPGYQLKVREALTLRPVDIRLAVSRR
jgi:unspecific monooxygenase